MAGTLRPDDQCCKEVRRVEPRWSGSIETRNSMLALVWLIPDLNPNRVDGRASAAPIDEKAYAMYLEVAKCR
jgi:hypothetical protein